MTEDFKLDRPASAEQAVQKEVEEKITRKPSRKLFGTFSGVFCEWFAWRISRPAIIFLIAAGISPDPV